MDFSSTAAFIGLLEGIVLCAGIIVGLEALHNAGMRRYQRRLTETLSADFERKARVVRELHPIVTLRLRLSRIVLDEIRQGSPDLVKVRHALDQISELLEEAAEESTNALKSFEGASRNEEYSR
jgi:signal transduction histidine kinase